MGFLFAPFKGDREMKDRKDAQLAHTLVEMTAATAGVLALTLVMPMALAESLFRTQFGPMALSLCAAGIVFGRYFLRSRGSRTAVIGGTRELQAAG
jgi:hypothetical protein